MKKLLTEDWVVTFLSIPLLIIAGLSSLLPNKGFTIAADLTHHAAWYDIAAFFIIALLLLYLGNRLLKRPQGDLYPHLL
jgi:membrane protein implicated in regulation of membrane protease activity